MNLNEDETFETRAQVDEPILEMYAYGSRVYGCVTEKSDHDYIIVVESEDENLNYSVTFTNFFIMFSIKITIKGKIIKKKVGENNPDPRLKPN